MKKQFLILFLLCAISIGAQTISKNKNLFSSNAALSGFSFLKEDPLKIEYQKYYNSSAIFSIYNPLPGFDPMKIEAEKYYSFSNTSLLLKREMKNREPEPIYPNQNKKKTFGETVFYNALSAAFNKK